MICNGIDAVHKACRHRPPVVSHDPFATCLGGECMSWVEFHDGRGYCGAEFGEEYPHRVAAIARIGELVEEIEKLERQVEELEERLADSST